MPGDRKYACDLRHCGSQSTQMTEGTSRGLPVWVKTRCRASRSAVTELAQIADAHSMIRRRDEMSLDEVERIAI
jgi:hypothetical protein